MTIEQKAKAYDEALEYAKSALDCLGDDYICNHLTKDDIRGMYANLFSELKESEDERTGREIINFINHRKAMGSITPEESKRTGSWIAWLEKQGEHANFRNKIQIGDKVTRNEDGVLVNLSQLNRVAKRDEKQGKSNMGISEDTKKKLEDNLHNALEKETPESWNEFLDEQGEQKPVWSEEDEDILNTIINHFKVDIECTDEDDTVRWLKSIKDRYTWKPSDAQMKALDKVLNFAANHESPYWNDYIFGTLNNLIRQLKKLMGEE